MVKGELMIFFEASSPDGWAIPGVHGNWEADEFDGNVQGGVFLIRDGNEGLLFDTGNNPPDGTASMGPLIERKLDEEHIDLKYIVISHFHYDHTGNAAFLRKKYGAQVVAHALDKFLIEDPMRIITPQNFERFGVSVDQVLEDFNLAPGESLGLSDPEIVAKYWNFPVEVDLEATNGTILTIGDTDLEILHLPGHTPGHIGLWNEVSRSLYCGDLIHFPTPLHPYPMGNAADHLRSLDRCLEKEPEYLWEGHFLGECSAAAAKRRLEHLKQMQDDVRRRLLRLLDRAPQAQTIAQLRPEVFPVKTDLNYTVSSGVGNRWAYAEACIQAHLRSMLDSGDVAREVDDGIVRFHLR